MQDVINVYVVGVGLDSTFGGLEAMITALCDEYPRTLGRNRELFVAGLLLCVYICALPTTTYVSQPVYTNSAGNSFVYFDVE